MIQRGYWFIVSVLLLAPSSVVFGQVGTQVKGSTIPNPARADDLAEFLEEIADFLLFLAIPVAIFFVIYAGFLFVTAQGNEEQIKTAKKVLIWSLIGVAVLLGAKVIAYAIKGTVELLRPSGGTELPGGINLPPFF